jgi:hypothetical protein
MQRYTKSILAAGVAAGLLAVPAMAAADGTLGMPNLSIADKGEMSLDFDARIFDGSEENEYFSGSFNYGLGNGYDLLIRFTTAEDFSVFDGGDQILSSGGDDIELMLRGSISLFPDAILALGVSQPDTPHQDENITFMTASLTYSQNIGEGADFIYGIRTVTRGEKSLTGLGAGISADIGSKARLAVDITAPLDGHNTSSKWDDEHHINLMLYSAMLEFNVNDDLSLRAGITNMMGGTTGMSLSPSLLNTNGVIFGGTLRF